MFNRLLKEKLYLQQVKDLVEDCVKQQEEEEEEKSERRI